MVIGIDVGGTTIKFGLIKLNGEVVSTHRIDTKKAAENEGIVEAMIEEVKKIYAQHSEVEGVGIGLPGLVSKNRKEIVLLPIFLKCKEMRLL